MTGFILEVTGAILDSYWELLRVEGTIQGMTGRNWNHVWGNWDPIGSDWEHKSLNGVSILRHSWGAEAALHPQPGNGSRGTAGSTFGTQPRVEGLLPHLIFSPQFKSSPPIQIPSIHIFFPTIKISLPQLNISPQLDSEPPPTPGFSQQDSARTFWKQEKKELENSSLFFCFWRIFLWLSCRKPFLSRR